MAIRKRTTLIGGAVVAVAALGIGGGVVAASDNDDKEPPIVGEDYERAEAAALAHTGGGTVTETEVGDEDSYYEVEVTLEDGRRVDVQLDESFTVVGSEADAADDDEGANDDD